MKIIKLNSLQESSKDEVECSSAITITKSQSFNPVFSGFVLQNGKAINLGSHSDKYDIKYKQLELERGLVQHQPIISNPDGFEKIDLLPWKKTIRLSTALSKGAIEKTYDSNDLDRLFSCLERAINKYSSIFNIYLQAISPGVDMSMFGWREEGDLYEGQGFIRQGYKFNSLAMFLIKNYNKSFNISFDNLFYIKGVLYDTVSIVHRPLLLNGSEIAFMQIHRDQQYFDDLENTKRFDMEWEMRKRITLETITAQIMPEATTDNTILSGLNDQESEPEVKIDNIPESIIKTTQPFVLKQADIIEK